METRKDQASHTQEVMWKELLNLGFGSFYLVSLDSNDVSPNVSKLPVLDDNSS